MRHMHRDWRIRQRKTTTQARRGEWVKRAYLHTLSFRCISRQVCTLHSVRLWVRERRIPKSTWNAQGQLTLQLIIWGWTDNTHHHRTWMHLKRRRCSLYVRRTQHLMVKQNGNPWSRNSFWILYPTWNSIIREATLNLIRSRQENARVEHSTELGGHDRQRNIPHWFMEQPIQYWAILE